MDNYNMLSGEEIVAKGATKIEVSLPEVGPKEAIPTGSWLEQKQIQSALEARKHLLETQRIEKSGMLTHAEWCGDLQLAEVKQNTGSYWQFMGHSRDKKLYLRPEEALFLMEVNCLLLRYNEVIVSLQQAYSLLLPDDISTLQYKVYASLSRVGYKVFRHIVKPSTKTSQTNSLSSVSEQKEDESVENNITKQVVSDKSTDEVEIKVSVDSETIQGNSSELNIINNVGTKNSDKNKMIVEENNLASAVKDDSENTKKKFSEANGACKEDVETNNSNSVAINEEMETESNMSDVTLSQQNVMNVEEMSMNFTEKSEEASVENVDGKLPGSLINDNVPQEGPDACTPMAIDSDKIISEQGNSIQQNVEHGTIEQPLRHTTDHSNKNIDPLTKYCQWKLEKLKNRQSKCPPNLAVHNSFKNCPDIPGNDVITLNTPKDEYLPKNVFLNKLSYVINIENVKNKNTTSTSSGSTYSMSDEVNGAHVRRVTNLPALPTTSAPTTNIRPSIQTLRTTDFPHFLSGFRPNVPFRQYNYWRPRPPNMNYFQFNLFLQRPYMANFNNRFQFYPRIQTPMFPRYCSEQNNFSADTEFREFPIRSRKRPKDDTKIIHLENLKKLAQRIRGLSGIGNLRNQNISAIQNLLQTYNVRFRTRLRLSEEFDIVDDAIVDTITLDDDDEELSIKKPRLDGQAELFVENFNRIRQTALRLKKMESKNKATARHRRALSSVIKTFNKYFKADIYMTDNYEVLDRRFINLDSSSDSDCVVEEVPTVAAGKKLRNPFNILKKLSEKQSTSGPTTSRPEVSEPPVNVTQNVHGTIIKEAFTQPWLPSENDFGKPEVISRDTMTARFIETKKEDLLFDFLKNQTYKFNNWVDLKIAFLESIEETNAIFQSEALIENNADIKSLVTPDDCTNMPAVLKKLRIINSNKQVNDKTHLEITYDVYNKDVKNFRKTNRPKPHFRVVCLEESSQFPSGIEIATLHASIEDNVPTLFAIVGISSVSYVQMNPTELQVNIPSTETG